MKGRTEVVLALGVGIFVFRAYSRGSLGNFWNTLWSGSSASVPSPTLGEIAGGNSFSSYSSLGGGSSGTFSTSAPFGFSPTSVFDYITQGTDPLIKQQDSLGLSQYKQGDTAAHDFDLAFNGQAPTVVTPFNLQYIGPDNGAAWGNAQVFQITSGPGQGGLIEFMHLGDIVSYQKGDYVPAGSKIGVPATNLPVSSNWSGPHLSVIVDPIASQAFQYIPLGSGAQA